MFTGIVEELGTVAGLEEQGDAVRLTVEGPLATADAALGDSISVNGCCLTVAALGDGTFTADVMKMTLDKTSLGALAAGHRVNLERACTPQTRLGGHIVQGHVDTTGTILARTPGEHWELVEIALPEQIRRYVVLHGIDHRRRHLAHRRRARRRELRRLPDPRDPRPHHARLQAARRPREPRGRTSSPSTSKG